MLDHGEVKHKKVMSTGLANALAKDNLSPWSRTGLRIFGVMLIPGISGFSYSRSDLTGLDRRH